MVFQAGIEHSGLSVRRLRMNTYADAVLSAAVLSVRYKVCRNTAACCLLPTR